MEKCAQSMLRLQFAQRGSHLETLDFFLRVSWAELHDDGWFFAAQRGIFSATSSELRPCQLMTVVLWTHTHS